MTIALRDAADKLVEGIPWTRRPDQNRSIVDRHVDCVAFVELCLARGSATDTVVIHVQNINDPPLASAARPTVSVLWPPNHQMISVGITGMTDPNNNATITITGVTQDEPTNGLGDGDTAIDAIIDADGTVLLRAERSGNGDGRVYRISFTASDLEGSSSGVVLVSVPHSAKKPAIDSGGVFVSTQ